MNTLKNLTVLQWIGIVLIINGAVTGGFNEVTDLVGSVWAKHLVSLATIGSSICGGLNVMFGGLGTQASNVRDGGARIEVGPFATAPLAIAAMNPTQTNIEAAPGASAAVAAIAKGAV